MAEIKKEEFSEPVVDDASRDFDELTMGKDKNPELTSLRMAFIAGYVAHAQYYLKAK